MRGTTTRWVLGFVGFVLLAAGGCTGGALHPFFSAGTRVAGAGIEGIWRAEDGKESYEVEAQEDGYLVTWTTRLGLRHHIVADVFEIGEQRFVDLLWDGMADPSEDQKAILKAQAMLSIPLHFCLALTVEPDRLHVRAIDPDWLGATLRQDPSLVGHAFLEDGRIVLTASTPDLQRFLRRISGETEAFGKEGVLVRATSPAPAAKGDERS